MNTFHLQDSYYNLFVNSKDLEEIFPAVIRSPGVGEYILTARNVSSTHESIRAEITLNDEVILKSSDFCEKKPVSITKDNPSDMNEDGYKVCKQKGDIYAPVSLKKTSNKLKVKIFGSKDAILEVSLKKK